MDLPQDAVPAQDPPQDPPSEPAPAGDPAPEQPVPVTPPGGADAIASAVAAVQQAVTPDDEAETAEEEAEEEEVVVAAPPEPEGPPGLRQRRRYAIVQAMDKVTAETMRFEVEVNGRPVAFNKTLIFRARACEVSASDEIARDAVAYLEISAQPRAGGQETRQLFRGWMFASSPGLSGLQHPVYDAWVVGCRA
ncbi:MAG: DUF2155 domain-containing protein [Caulobacteraceae bacterium]|nr:DUF2155 domain-containing protein [Caulobacteraceae bacterium]